MRTPLPSHPPHNSSLVRHKNRLVAKLFILKQTCPHSEWEALWICTHMCILLPIPSLCIHISFFFGGLVWNSPLNKPVKSFLRETILFFFRFSHSDSKSSHIPRYTSNPVTDVQTTCWLHPMQVEPWVTWWLGLPATPRRCLLSQS